MPDLVPVQPMASDSFEQVLANMELRALKVRNPEERARIYNLAGDMCFDAGLKERTLSFYGRAIDVHVAAEQLDAAVAVCRKIVRLTPEVVRARCTLAWMALGRGLIQEARDRVGDYARAAAAAGQEERARQHLRLMSEVSENQEVLETLAEALLELGDAAGANRAFGAAMGHRGSSDLPADPEERWAAVLRLLGHRDIALVPVELVVQPEAEPVEEEPTAAGPDPLIALEALVMEAIPEPSEYPSAAVNAMTDTEAAIAAMLEREAADSGGAGELVANSESEQLQENVEPVCSGPSAPRPHIADLSPLARRRRRVRQTGL